MEDCYFHTEKKISFNQQPAKVFEKEKIDKAYSTYLNPIKFQKLYEMSLNEFILASELLYKMTEYNQILD